MKTTRILSLVALALTTAATLQAQEQPAKVIRAGMIGLDTSHVPAFARLFNNNKADADLSGVRIVAAYPGGTDWPTSRDRVERFTGQIRDMGIEIVDSIPDLLAKVDVVLLESVDGRIHLEEAVPVIQAKKPLWIDKPVAGSLVDAIVIYELAARHDVPVFSSSSARYNAAFDDAFAKDKVGDIAGATTWGSVSYTPGTPDMFFYGIHGIEPLFKLLGTGCQSVSRLQSETADVVTGVWSGGRIGQYRGIRKGNSSAGAVVFGNKAIVQVDKSGGYDGLCRQIGRFFKSGKSPVSAAETLEIYAFMEAADESKRQNGAPVALADVLAKARAEAEAKLSKLK